MHLGMIGFHTKKNSLPSNSFLKKYENVHNRNQENIEWTFVKLNDNKNTPSHTRNL